MGGVLDAGNAGRQGFNSDDIDGDRRRHRDNGRVVFLADPIDEELDPTIGKRRDLVHRAVRPDTEAPAEIAPGTVHPTIDLEERPDRQRPEPRPHQCTGELVHP